jgi:type I restriction enzyme S subunit
MQSNYKRLGDYIKEVSIKNTDLKVNNLIGVSIDKKFIKSVANTIGVDMSTYKIIQKNQLACKLMSVGRDEKLPVDLYVEEEPSLVSSAYYVFEPIDSNVLMPEYLKMWLFRSETDRFVGYVSGGDVRGGISWETFCDIPIKVPAIEKQQEIVNEYHTIQKRINLNYQLIAKLEETAQTIYKQWFVEGIDLQNLPVGWKTKVLSEIASIKGGKRLPKGEELNDLKLGRPYIKVADMKKTKYLVLNDKFQYVSNDIQSLISRYIINSGDLIISIVGTIGMINIIDDSLNNANLTENCFKINGFKLINANYLYHYLNSEIGKRVIEERTVGGVQGKLPMYNVESMPILIPEENLLHRFNIIIDKIDKTTLNKIKENQKLEELKELLLGRMVRN